MRSYLDFEKPVADLEAKVEELRAVSHGGDTDSIGDELTNAEDRGQAEAIARSTETSLGLGVPNVAVIVGEGGSGGAVAIASCNKVLMLEHAIYTVASPEASASILWRDAGRAEDAATGMKITAQDLLRFGIIDGIVPEPPGGAHRDPERVIAATGEAVSGALAALGNMSREQLKSARAEKFLAMGRKV